MHCYKGEDSMTEVQARSSIGSLLGLPLFLAGALSEMIFLPSFIGISWARRLPPASPSTSLSSLEFLGFFRSVTCDTASSIPISIYKKHFWTVRRLERR